jgi:phosphoribosylformylglycinamidine (FGAM) synthase PurS component
MTQRTIAVTLKIPDNAALTALAALRRLGVDVSRLERADVWQFEDEGFTPVEQRFEQNETLFNPNKHELGVLESNGPREGEVWIEMLDAADVPLRMTGASHARRFTSWRLFRKGKDPADAAHVRDAAEKLLCNPAIERAKFRE